MQPSTARLRSALVLSGSILLFTGCGGSQSTTKSPDSSASSASSTSSQPLMAASPKPMVMPATMPAVEPVVLKFTDKSIQAIQTGTKTATIRKGARMFPTKTARAVGANGNIVMLTIVSATPKKMSELTASDATANGSASLDALKTELAADYKNIAPGDVVTVIVFKLASVAVK